MDGRTVVCSLQKGKSVNNFQISSFTCVFSCLPSRRAGSDTQRHWNDFCNHV